MAEKSLISFRPSGHYWRESIEVSGIEALREIARALAHDLERHKTALRDLEVMPPKTYWAPGELMDKHGYDPSPGRPSPCVFRAHHTAAK